MTRQRGAVLRILAAWLVAMGFATEVRAEPSPADKSLATVLFQQGRALLEQNRVAEACRRFEESQRLDPGGGTLLNLASCHEREGRTATAWAEFTEALGTARRDRRTQRIELAEARINALEPKLCRLEIVVSSAVDMPGLEVKRDGTSIGRAAWGLPMPVDPGEHVVEVAAPGKKPWRASLVVKNEAETWSLTVPPLADAPAAPPPAKPGAGAPNATDSAGLTQETPAAPAGGPPLAAAWTAGVIGVVGIGVGSYFGLRAMSKQKESDRACPYDVCRPGSDGLLYDQQARQAADLSTVGFTVGAVGLGVSAWLFLAHKSSPPQTGGLRITTPIGKTSAGLQVDGSF
jgi:hypothetical protein